MSGIDRAREGRVEFANGLRGVAALAVLVTHCLGFWFIRDYVAPLQNWPVVPASTPTPEFIVEFSRLIGLFPHLNLGSFGVALFFIISGFVVPFSLRATSVPSFLVARFVRLWPVYAVAFSITLLSTWAVGLHFGTPWNVDTRDALLHYAIGVRDLLMGRNLDGIVWTLDIEMKFYIAASAVAALMRRRSLLLFLAPLAIVIFYVVIIANIESLAHMGGICYHLSVSVFLFSAPYIVWIFVGVVFHYLHCKSIGIPVAIALSVMLFASFCGLLAIGPHSAHLENSAWSFFYALAVFAACMSASGYITANPVTDFFANISYPMYAVHFFPGRSLARYLLDIGLDPTACAIALAFVTIGAAWGLHLLVEVPSRSLGRAIATGEFRKRTVATSDR